MGRNSSGVRGREAYAPGRQQSEVPKGGAVIFFATQNIQKFCELCWGRDRHGRTNHVRRKMRILDVISSVSRSSKCTKIVSSWGFAPNLTGRAYSAPPDPLAGFKGPRLKPLLLRGRREGVERGAKMIYAPRCQNLVPPVAESSCWSLYGIHIYTITIRDAMP